MKTLKSKGAENMSRIDEGSVVYICVGREEYLREGCLEALNVTESGWVFFALDKLIILINQPFLLRLSGLVSNCSRCLDAGVEFGDNRARPVWGRCDLALLQQHWVFHLPVRFVSKVGNMVVPASRLILNL